MRRLVPWLVWCVLLCWSACSRFEPLNPPDVPSEDTVDIVAPPNLCKDVVCDLSDLLLCYYAVCDPKTGSCVVETELDGTSCVDTDLCTTDTKCQDGLCVGSAVICPDPGLCQDAVCEPKTGCGSVNQPDDDLCDDNDACTLKTVCSSGFCTATMSKECDEQCPGILEPDVPCSSCVCNSGTGACEPLPVNLGGLCDADDNGCTVLDSCGDAGTCVPGDEKSCDDGIACTDDVCESLGADDAACQNTLQSDACLIQNANDVSECWGENTPKPENVCLYCDPTLDSQNWSVRPSDFSCDDENGCTNGDLCLGGTCEPGALTDCDDGLDCTMDHCVSDGSNASHCEAPIQDQACVLDDMCYQNGDVDPGNECRTCDVDTSATVWTPVADKTPCDLDSDGCTEDACSEDGVCTQAFVVACDDSLSCTDDQCESTSPMTYECSNAYNGSGCAIGEGACVSNGDFNPSNACQKCLPDVSTTTWSDVPNSTPCQDGDGCTEDDVCLAGNCESGVLQSCEDGLDCTQGSCVSEGGDAFVCNQTTEENWCVIDSNCVSVGTSNATNPCLLCTPTSAQNQWSSADASTLCNADDDACTVNDHCDGKGQCISGQNGDELCQDAHPCTQDTCVPDNGSFVCENVVVGHCLIAGQCVPAQSENPNNECEWCDPTVSDNQWTAKGLVGGKVPLCNADSNGCTVNDACVNGNCLTGEMPNCGDGLGCTEDSCQSLADNEYTCANVQADDSCLIDDVCYTGGTVKSDEPCQTCSPPSNASQWTMTADGVSCVDINQCTEDEVCSAGKCTGTATKECGDGDVCTANFCDPVEGCKSVATTLPCDDGIACTTPDQCADGVCQPGPEVNCPCLSPNRARSFGTSCVLIATLDPLLGDEGFTIEFWIRTSTINAGVVLEKRSTSAGGDNDWWISYQAAGAQGRLTFHYGTANADGSVAMTNVAINDGAWRHVALVWSPTNMVSWWIDGKENVSAQSDDALPFGNAAPFYMGCDAAIAEPFEGDLDEVRVSKYARYIQDFTPPSRHRSDIATTALWHLDEGPGDIVSDGTVNGFDGVSVGGVAQVATDVAPSLDVCCGNNILENGEACDDFNTTPGDGCGPYCDREDIVGQSLLFDGTTGCLEVDGEGLLSASPSMAVEFWLKTSAVNRVVMDTESTQQNALDFTIRLDSVGRLVFSGSGLSELNTGTIVNDGKWHHALVHLSKQLPLINVTWFVDSVESGNKISFSSNPWTGDADVRVGCSYETLAAYEGQLDEVRVRSSSLTLDAGLVESDAPLVPDGQTLLLLNFDHPSLEAGALDLSAYGRHATVLDPDGVQLVDDSP